LDALSVLLLDLGIPLLLLVVLFPLLTGLVTGNNTASVAISVPLFLPLLPAGAWGRLIWPLCLSVPSWATRYLPFICAWF
jgi:hypothetical protein